jgi:hypothetical protein
MNNKLTSRILLAAVALVCGASLVAQTSGKKEPAAQQKKQGGGARLSPHETINARIPLDQGRSLITLTYGRPHAQKGGKGEVRKIWGGLVPWGKADRLGADEATLILLQHPIAIGSTTIPAGAHTLYIVPAETGASKLAFSSNIGKWGIPVDESHDIARVDLTKEELPEQVDQLTLAIESTGPKAGVLKIKWEKTQYSVPFTVKA